MWNEWILLKNIIDNTELTDCNLTYEEVNCDDDDAVNKYNLMGYPTIRFVVNDIAVDYTGTRDAKSMINDLLTCGTEELNQT